MVAFTDNAWDVRGQDGKDRSHIPPQPLWAGAIRVAELVLAFIVLVLTAYAASHLNSDASSFGMTWFTFIWTVLYTVWLGISLVLIPTIYNIWVQLALESLTTFWWLVSWALLARDASGLTQAERFFSVSRTLKSAFDCVKASAALGALIWVLATVNLVFFILALIKHHNATASQEPPAQPMTNIPPGQQPGYAQPQPPPEGYPQAQYPEQQAYPPQQYPVNPEQQQQAVPPQQDYAAQQQQPYPAQPYPQSQSPYPPPGTDSPHQQQSPYVQPQQPPYPQQQQQAPYPQ